MALDGSQGIDAASLFWRQIAGTTAIELTVTDACGATSVDTVSIVVVRT